MNGEELPSVDSAAGFNPAATLSLASAKRRYEQLFRKIPTVYRKESIACGEAARAMRGNHLGSPYKASPWRPDLLRPQHANPEATQAFPRVTTQKNPNRIPEREQARRRSRPADERVSVTIWRTCRRVWLR